MKYIHKAYIQFKKLQSRNKGEYRELFRIEQINKNRSTIKIILMMILLIYVLFILFIDIPRFKEGSLFTIRSYLWIFIGRSSVLVISLISLTVSFFSDPEADADNYRFIGRIQKLITILITLTLMTNAVGDYLLQGSIQTYIGVILALAILVLMTNLFSFFFFFLTFILFTATLTYLAPAHQFISATLFSDCFSFSLLSFIASRLFYYSELNKFHQKMIIVKQKNKLEELSVVDQLTKAYNRRKFDDLISTEIERANRYGHRFTLVMFDIDHFKEVNDTYGHSAGDAVLTEICALVSRNLRKTDSLIRWGGEEFIVLAVETTLPNARILGEKLRGLISEYEFPTVGRITSSFGISDYINSETAENLMKRVDEALYQAKKNGRNRIETV